MNPRITALGDRALIVEFAQRLGDVDSSYVHAACAWLADGKLAGVSELVPAATTVTLFYSAAELQKAGAPRTDLAGWLVDRVRQRLATMPGHVSANDSREIEIPVCYGGEFGPDLVEVAERTGQSPEAVIAAHAGANYRVLQLGFAPGFPYLEGLPTELSLARRESPRTRVPAGSVAIANGQTCIYPVAIAGGWHLIGRTPVRLFQPDHDPPVIFKPGDRVKFRPIAPEEFNRWEDAP